MHTVEIADPAELQSVLEEIKNQLGTDTKAAVELGITRDTFRNLRVGRVTDSMKYETFAAIYAYLGGEPSPFGRVQWPTEFAALLDARDREDLAAEHRANLEVLKRRTQAIGPEAAADPQAYLDAQARARYDLYERFMKSVVLGDVRLVWSNYEAWMSQELVRLRPTAEPVLFELWEYRDGWSQPYRRRIQTFLEAVGRSREELPPRDDLRCWLAMYRAVAPLADHVPTWGIERTWVEMHEAEKLTTYLKAAFNREALLLDPPEDLKRVKRGRVPWDHLNEAAAQDAQVEENRYRYWLRDEVTRLRGEACWSVFRWLWERPTYRRLIEAHLQEVRGSAGLPPYRNFRQWLGILRPLEPLAARTGGVERSCVELHRAGQLETYLRNALENERIMLAREDDKSRLEQRRRRKFAWLGELEGDVGAAEDHDSRGDVQAERKD